MSQTEILRAQVVGKTTLTPTVFELRFTTEPCFSFAGGQFVSVVVPHSPGKPLRRAYSLASAPENPVYELCVKQVEGPGTNFLAKLREGQEFEVFAPFGVFKYKTPTTRHVCFIATGTGIAPFRSMVLSKHYSEHPPKSATVLFGVREASEILYEEELKSAGVRWRNALSRADEKYSGFRGRVTEYLDRNPQEFDWAETDFYLCGNGEMIHEIKARLISRGVAKAAIHQEKYY